MNRKVLNLLLIITSLFGYLEWSGGNNSFLFQAEYELISKLFSEPNSVIHPFTILPMLGQVILLITLFQNNPSKILTIISVGCLGLLLGFMFIIGMLSLNYKILLSTIPFLTCAVLTFRVYKTKTTDE